jgi:8-oxo-dGTP pyrophosphatase MutT (NUDIX family)
MSDSPRTLVRDRYGDLRLVQECVSVLAWAPGNKLLSVSRQDDWTRFTLPGGKVDPEDRRGGSLDSLRRAARRELREETGLDASELEPVFADFDTGDHFTTTFWAPRVFGEIGTDEPHLVRWVSPDVILRGPFGSFYERMFRALDSVGGRR